MKIPLMLPLELVDLICEKINRKILRNISIYRNVDDILSILNRKRIEKYWEKMCITNLIFINDLPGVKYLIEIEANIVKINHLTCASIYGRLEILKYLAEIGADIHENEDYTIIFAASFGHLEVVKYLVEIGADIHADDDQVLISACRYGHLEVVKYLVSQGVNIHIKDEQPLLQATWGGHFEIVKYLISLGAYFQGSLALVYARNFNHVEIVEYLLSQGEVKYW
jgi:ankyrin repeat protein